MQYDEMPRLGDKLRRLLARRVIPTRLRLLILAKIRRTQFHAQLCPRFEENAPSMSIMDWEEQRQHVVDPEIKAYVNSLVSAVSTTEDLVTSTSC